MITVVLPVSRTEYLRPVFECLNNLRRPHDTELLILTDGSEMLQKAVDKRLDLISFPRIQVVGFGDTPGEDRNSRRYRISEIHNKAKNYISNDCDYVFCVEDDTIYPPEALIKMLEVFNLYEDCGYVEGVELGRHKTKYIGAWEADYLVSPGFITSVMPGKGLQKISAGGLYCCVTRADLYKQHHFEPYDKEGVNGLSCDVNYGMWLSEKGYVCFIDWDIQCDHIGDKGSVNLGNTKPVKVQFAKDFKGKWSSKVIL